MYTTIQIRRDTTASWTTNNPTLELGELGFETDTGKAKLGNGSTAWTSLPYVISTYWENIQNTPSELSYLNGLVTNVQQKFNELDSTISGMPAVESGTSGVTSINGQSGIVTLDAADVGAATTSHTHNYVSTVNGQSGIVTLDAADVGAATTSHTHNYVSTVNGQSGPNVNLSASNVGAALVSHNHDTIYLKLSTVNTDHVGTELSGFATEKHLLNVTNDSTSGYSHGVVGWSHSSQGSGVVGSTRAINGGGVYGIYANGPIETTFTTYGRLGTRDYSGYFWGANVTVVGGSFSPFTGSHYCLTESTQNMNVGDIVCNTQAILLDVNDSISVVQLSSVPSDKNVIGVVAKKDAFDTIEEFCKNFKELSTPDTNGATIATPQGDAFCTEHSTKSNVIVNSLGEGGINVCDVNGDIVSGDYICTSSVPGKGTVQADDIMRSSTVAKALEDVVWANETVGIDGCYEVNGAKCKMISCTYHCG